MPQDRPLPGSAEDWLTRAEGDLALALMSRQGAKFAKVKGILKNYSLRVVQLFIPKFTFAFFATLREAIDFPLQRLGFE
jgi:hypothetical protein